ncbi:FtsK/SpoIIIE domain-containing protein [Lachnobacterium bovis]|uniref:FtsK/SpoIIIE domain-containing protein n=1 Tax=Lachnobacterium bovis TaxID=140626 RepID=UPI0009E3B8AE|nr:FtsK/SpoIIIE domain-containing protein [Lachnobacterium bovis]
MQEQQVQEKSEIVQSYILSLALNFHPYEVGFLLIDYKGGGMQTCLKNLPHLLGTITNLDKAESMRAMLRFIVNFFVDSRYLVSVELTTSMDTISFLKKEK